QNTDDGMVLNIKLDTANYKGVFMGKVEDATLDATIMGTPTADGFYEYQLPITEDMLGTTTDITILKKDGKTFYTNKNYSLVLNLGQATPQIGPSAKAQAIIDTINALPEASAISYDDAANLRSARSAYNALMSARQAEVSNYDKLVACEEAYRALPVLWPALDNGYGWINGNDFVTDPYFNVAYKDNYTNLFVRIYVDARNFNRVLAMPASEVTADVTGGSLTAVPDSDTGYYGFTAKEVQLGKVCHYTLAKIENGEVKATHEISFLLPSFRMAALEAGTYEMAAQSTVAALNNVPATLVSADGAMTATVTPSAAVAKIYLGTAEAAAAATEGIIEPAADGTLTFPVASIELPTAIAVFDGTAWTDEKIQIVADAETQAVITAIQGIYSDGVDENGKALTRAAYWDIYPADKPAVEAAQDAYDALTDAQKAVVKQSNWSELAHAVAMFANAEDITAQIEALPDLTEVTTYEQAQAIMAAKKSYDEAGDDIFTWCPAGSSSASIQERYIYKLMPADAKAKIADQAALAETAMKPAFTVTPSATNVKPGDTITVDIAVKTVMPLGAAQLKLTSSDTAALKLISVQKGAGLSMGEGGSFDATVNNGLVSFYGNTAVAGEGLVIATATFQAEAEGTADIAISEVVCGASAGAPDIEDVVIPAAQTITIAYAGDFMVSDSPFTNSGMKVVTFVGDVPEGMVPTLAGVQMVKMGDNFVALATAEQAAALTRADLGMVEAEAAEIGPKGDANLNGKVNIVDAQIAYDISCCVYTDFSVLPMMGFFNAEVNGDKFVDAADALAIQNFVMRGAFK
ncbi:MAG: cohesin domain-containing protein, partial [Eggerthellales bacterium]|nr:cohesin domain-containing protein [Eggerthellales bacterium]